MKDIYGTGIGLRGSFINDVALEGFQPDWFEITPENWFQIPAFYRESFEKIADKFPLVAHGVSLSLGSPEPCDKKLLGLLKKFFEQYDIRYYSEHLSYSTFDGKQSYELLPVPMTLFMANHIADKIKSVNDILGRSLILENASWYYMPYAEMDEADFINIVLEKSGAPMLLDVNNVYVNSVNHKFDPFGFIDKLNLSRTAYIHIAGHTYFPDNNLVIDTHGDFVRGEVFDLLQYTLEKINRPVPVMIERDNNIPPLPELVKEYNTLKEIVNAHQKAGV
jgi:hypothetical protein